MSIGGSTVTIEARPVVLDAGPLIHLDENPPAFDAAYQTVVA